MSTTRHSHACAGSDSVPAELDTLLSRLHEVAAPLALARDYLSGLSSWLNQQYLDGVAARALIARRAAGIDALLRALWNGTGLTDCQELVLIAVGGYGRRELHPHSDIDLLLLAADDGAADAARPRIESFVAMLWDVGLEIGHAVRSLAQCRELAAAELTIITNLIESRPLCGDAGLHAELITAVSQSRMWNSREFFRAKREEQIARHRRFSQSEYNLEPNLKSCPGGLRDIQMIGWVAKRHFATRTIHELVAQGFLTQQEYDALVQGQDFLWHLRWGLHMIAGRAEDRLLFDHQRRLAQLFGLRDSDQGLAVEQLMKDYYRWALQLGTLNEMLIQLLDEAILRACEPESTLEVNRRFRIRNGYMEVTHDRVFSRSPYALIEIFVLLAQHPNIDGIRASTIRLIRQNTQLIDQEFRHSPRNNQLFLKLLASPHKVATQLRRMHRYGVLSRFIPEFGRIVGMMQHDLFHIFTVDAHTLQVVKNMRRFNFPDERRQFPVAAHVMRRLPRPELLYIAGLFHDLAKGRGGDHSELGAVDATRFCGRLSLSPSETRLVSWLVRHHLIMSTTSQRKDLSDPNVIREFAQLVGDRRHLDHLYALTVADINATNPNLWNSWRASLLRSLYQETKLALRRGLENPVDRRELVEETRERALKKLLRRGFNREQVNELWQHLGEDYFARETVADIAWQAEAMLRHGQLREPIVLVREAGNRFAGVTHIFVFTRDVPGLFAKLTARLERLGLDVHGARIYSSSDGHVLDSFFVLERDGRGVGDQPQRIREIQDALRDGIERDLLPDSPHGKRTPRRLKHFMAATRTMLSDNPHNGTTLLEVVTTDRPGLLARIGRTFVEHGIQVRDARISTLGERVEDVFFITDADGQPLCDPEAMQALQDSLRDSLDSDLEQRDAK